MNYGTIAVAETAKKVYYVLRNKSHGFVQVPKANVSLGAARLGGLSRQILYVSFVAQRLATQYASIDALLTAWGLHGVYNGTYSSNLEIVRIEEAPGVATRRVAKCGETPTGFVVGESAFSFLRDPDAPLCNGWAPSINEAKVFTTEADAIQALNRRAIVQRIAYRTTILRIIDVPATPIITETTLS